MELDGSFVSVSIHAALLIKNLLKIKHELSYSSNFDKRLSEGKMKENELNSILVM